MLRFLVTRLLQGIAILFGVAVVVFLLVFALPADPVRLTMGQRTDLGSVETVRRELGLDKPLPVQLALYLNDLSPVSLHRNDSATRARYDYVALAKPGNQMLVVKWPYLRQSYQSGRPVADVLMQALPNTLVLAFAAFAIACLIGVTAGMVSGISKKKWLADGIMFFALSGVSAPSFFAAIIIAYLFGFLWADWTGLGVTGSLVEIDAFRGRTIAWRNLVLPALALGIRPAAIITQLMRSSVKDVLAADYVRTARAKGMSRNVIVWRHVFRNALNPVVTALSGWLASLLAGAFFVEYIFNWNGLGKVTVEALLAADLPLLMGSVMLTAAVFVVISTLADVLYGVIDPRVKP